MSPEELSVKNTESGHQKALFAWSSMARLHGFDVANDMQSYSASTHSRTVAKYKIVPVDELEWLHSIPNGGARDPKTAALMKAEGVRRGIPDVFLPVACHGITETYHGLYIEMKTSTGRQSEEQKAFEKYCNKHNYIYKVCKNWQEAAKLIKIYLDADVCMT